MRDCSPRLPPPVRSCLQSWALFTNISSYPVSPPVAILRLLHIIFSLLIYLRLVCIQERRKQMGVQSAQINRATLSSVKNAVWRFTLVRVRRKFLFLDLRNGDTRDTDWSKEPRYFSRASVLLDSPLEKTGKRNYRRRIKNRIFRVWHPRRVVTHVYILIHRRAVDLLLHQFDWD